MSLSCPRRAVAALLVALSACAVVPAAASAKKQDLKVMTRNLYLGADIIPLAAATDEASFEQAAAQRFQTVLNNNFPARAKLVAAEIKKAKPDLVGLQEATTWRRGADGVKDGPATPATQVVYDSTSELLKALKKAKSPYKVVVKRDWFDFEAPTALGYDVRITQTDVVLARKGSKVKLGKSFKGGYKTTSTRRPCAAWRRSCAAGSASTRRWPSTSSASSARTSRRTAPTSPTSRCRSC